MLGFKGDCDALHELFVSNGTVDIMLLIYSTIDDPKHGAFHLPR